MSSGTPQKISGRSGGSSPGTTAPLQQNLQRLDRLANLGLFSAGIAHEIKNGMVAVNTFCEVLLEKDGEHEMAEVVRRELKRINGLVSQMLKMAAAKPATLAPVNVHALLDVSVRLLEHQTTSRMITVRREYGPGSDLVQGDEARLQQAVLNLLLNAIEAMGQGGVLTVATLCEADQVRIIIRDTGGGIAPENFSHIFETFFTTKKNGTGLGLAITRQVVEEHHGEIEVESELGHGSTFTLILPHA